MNAVFSVRHFRFHLEPKAALRMPLYNKGNVMRGGFGSTLRPIVCNANSDFPDEDGSESDLELEFGGH